jgi:hypothetical protein
MKATLTITDLTRMQGKRVCIAGYTHGREPVRPVVTQGGGLTEGWLSNGDAVVIQPFALVEFDLQRQKPQPPHTEDWIINPAHRTRRGQLDPAQQQQLLDGILDENVAAIFGTTILHDPGWYVMLGTGRRSLGTVRPANLEVSYGLRSAETWDYRLAFTDTAGASYRLSVTDLAFRYFLDNCRTCQGAAPGEAAQALTATLNSGVVYLRIGLSRGWDKFPDRCFLQITGVHTFPDYLNGRCFSELRLDSA